MGRKYFGTDGVRGKVGLTPSTVTLCSSMPEARNAAISWPLI